MWLAKVNDLDLLKMMHMVGIDVFTEAAKDLNASFLAY